jgi:hypothetical protein
MKASFLSLALAGVGVAIAKPSPVIDLVPRATETALVQEILNDIEHLATCVGGEVNQQHTVLATPITNA